MEKKQKQEEPKVIIETTICSFTCQICKHKEKKQIPVEDLNNSIVKTMKCNQCGSFGSYLLETTLKNKEIKKIILTRAENNNKFYFLDESYNSSLAKKRKIYSDRYSDEEISSFKPYHGINNCKNYGSNLEFFVNDSLMPTKEQSC